MAFSDYLNFEVMGEQLFSYLCTIHQHGAGFSYPLQAGQPGSLYGSAFAAFVAHMLGRTDELPGRDRLVENIASLRDPETGLFSDPDLTRADFRSPQTHSELYVSLQTTYFCTAALKSLGAAADHRVFWLEPLLKEGAVYRWLDDLDWSNPWLVSNLDMFVGIFLLDWRDQEQNDRRVAAAVDEYFSWHDEKQDARTGFWGSQQDLFNAMAGAYHILIHYDYAGREISCVEAMIDSTLKLVARDGLFVYGGGGGSCEDMDAIDILVRLSRLSDYRIDEVRKVLLGAARRIALGQSADGGFGWRIQPRLRGLVPTLQTDPSLFPGQVYDCLYKLRNRSHYCSTYYYSSLQCYPFALNVSDTWSSWFRPLAVAFVAHRFPELFNAECNWRFPTWPGLGYESK